MRQRYLWYKVSHIPATTLLCWRLYICSKFGITKFCALCSPYPCACSFSYCHILIFTLQLFPLPSFLPFFTVNFFSRSLPSTPLYFSPFVPPLLCPPYLSLLRLLFFKTLCFSYHLLSFPSSLHLYFLIFLLLFPNLLIPLVFVLRF
jgi:hypothetical protein